MKYASLVYTTSSNLGDQIQSLALEQFLPFVDQKFDRDYLHEVNVTEKHLLIMQGWFSHYPERCFPPAECIIPVFFGFHISDWNNSWEHFLKPPNVEYLKKHEPIGCRDQQTANILSKNGINSFYSKCLTLTFPTRTKSPVKGKVFLVDVEGIPIPESIKNNAIVIHHDVIPIWGEEIKLLMAKQLLKTYREEANLIITTRLHAALPCIAMGIPVVFFGNSDDYRTSIIKDLGIPINPLPKKTSKKPKILKIVSRLPQYKSMISRNIEKQMEKTNWYPKPLSIEDEKLKIIERLKLNIEAKIKISGK
jgi:hypothetical protein